MCFKRKETITQDSSHGGGMTTLLFHLFFYPEDLSPKGLVFKFYKTTIFSFEPC